ncbi:hypothetical protein [Micromonospora sp. NPDC023814]|uniref:hypothetical protein n=1 Tax=Micromonospora sp. NPDC023814 TaxID=3154596 RepID=UPI00340049D6
MVAFIDLDLAASGHPLEDVGYMAWPGASRHGPTGDPGQTGPPGADPGGRVRVEPGGQRADQRHEPVGQP